MPDVVPFSKPSQIRLALCPPVPHTQTAHEVLLAYRAALAAAAPAAAAATAAAAGPGAADDSEAREAAAEAAAGLRVYLEGGVCKVLGDRQVRAGYVRTET